MTDQVFALSYSPALRPLFAVLGMGPSLTRAIVGPGDLTVRMGWAFTVRIPRANLTDHRLDDGRVSGWGVHGWGGRWLVNGSAAGLVRLRLDPPVRGRLLTFFPVTVQELRLSLADPERFLAALTE